MATIGKKYRAAAAKVDPARNYAAQEAVELVKQTSYTKFDATVDVAVRLGVDPRHADQVVRGTVILPHGTGKTVRVLVVAQGDRAREAEAAGADFVGLEYLQKLKDGWLECDVIVATPDVMGQLGALGRILGPRGLMPNPKAGTVTMDVTRAVNEIKAGKIEFRVDKTGNVHVPIGKVSFSGEQLGENLHDVFACEPSLDFNRKTFSRVFIDDRKHTDLSSIRSSVFNKIIAPHMVWVLWS